MCDFKFYYSKKPQDQRFGLPSILKLNVEVRNLNPMTYVQVDNSARAEAIQAINSERYYQNRLWNNDVLSKKDPSGWILWMEDYIATARHLASTTSEEIGTKSRDEILAVVRKVGGLAVACMEACGAVPRDIKDLQDALVSDRVK